MEPASVCRLCSNQRNLLDVSSDNTTFAAEYRNIVRIMTGITIYRNDKLPSMICRECLKRAIENYDYRRNARIRNKELQRKCGRVESKKTNIAVETSNTSPVKKEEEEDNEDVQFVSISMDMTVTGCDTPPPLKPLIPAFDNNVVTSSNHLPDNTTTEPLATNNVPSTSNGNVSENINSTGVMTSVDCEQTDCEKVAVDINKLSETRESNDERLTESETIKKDSETVGAKRKTLSEVLKEKRALEVLKLPNKPEANISPKKTSSKGKTKKALNTNKSKLTAERDENVPAVSRKRPPPAIAQNQKSTSKKQKVETKQTVTPTTVKQRAAELEITAGKANKRHSACTANDRIAHCKENDIYGSSSSSSSSSEDGGQRSVTGKSVLSEKKDLTLQTDFARNNSLVKSKEQNQAKKKCDNFLTNLNISTNTEFDNLNFPEFIDLHKFTSAYIKLTHSPVKKHIVKLNRRLRRRQKGGTIQLQKHLDILKRLDIPDIMPTSSKELKALLTSSLGLERTGPASPEKKFIPNNSPEYPVLSNSPIQDNMDTVIMKISKIPENISVGQNESTTGNSEDVVPETAVSDTGKNHNLDYSLLTMSLEEVVYVCDFCHRVFKNKGAYGIHKKKVHQKCPLCKKLFNSVEAMHNHSRTTCYKRMLSVSVKVLRLEADKQLRKFLPTDFLDTIKTTPKKPKASRARKSTTHLPPKPARRTELSPNVVPALNDFDSSSTERSDEVLASSPKIVPISNDFNDVLPTKQSDETLAPSSPRDDVPTSNDFVDVLPTKQSDETLAPSSPKDVQTLKDFDSSLTDQSDETLSQKITSILVKTSKWEAPAMMTDNANNSEVSPTKILEPDVLRFAEDNVVQDNQQTIKIVNVVSLNEDSNGTNAETGSNSNSKTSWDVESLSNICLTAKACTPIQEIEDIYELSDVDSLQIADDPVKGDVGQVTPTKMSLKVTGHDIGKREMDETMHILKLINKSSAKKHVGASVQPKDFVAVNIVDKSITIRNLGDILSNNQIVPVKFNYQQGRRVETLITDYERKRQEERFFDFSRKVPISMDNYKQMRSKQKCSFRMDWASSTASTSDQNVTEKTNNKKKPCRKKKSILVTEISHSPLSSTSSSEPITSLSGQHLDLSTAQQQLTADISEPVTDNLLTNQPLDQQTNVPQATDTQEENDDNPLVIVEETTDTPGNNVSEVVLPTEEIQQSVQQKQHVPTIKILTPQAINNRTVMANGVTLGTLKEVKTYEKKQIVRRNLHQNNSSDHSKPIVLNGSKLSMLRRVRKSPALKLQATILCAHPEKVSSQPVVPSVVNYRKNPVVGLNMTDLGNAEATFSSGGGPPRKKTKTLSTAEPSILPTAVPESLEALDRRHTEIGHGNLMTDGSSVNSNILKRALQGPTSLINTTTPFCRTDKNMVIGNLRTSCPSVPPSNPCQMLVPNSIGQVNRVYSAQQYAPLNEGKWQTTKNVYTLDATKRNLNFCGAGKPVEVPASSSAINANLLADKWPSSTVALQPPPVNNVPMIPRFKVRPSTKYCTGLVK